MRYYVMSDNGMETIRTDKRAAEADVRLLKDIVRRNAWIEEGA